MEMYLVPPGHSFRRVRRPKLGDIVRCECGWEALYEGSGLNPVAEAMAPHLQAVGSPEAFAMLERAEREPAAPWIRSLKSRESPTCDSVSMWALTRAF